MVDILVMVLPVDMVVLRVAHMVQIWQVIMVGIVFLESLVKEEQRVNLEKRLVPTIYYILVEAAVVVMKAAEPVE